MHSRTQHIPRVLTAVAAIVVLLLCSGCGGAPAPEEMSAQLHVFRQPQSLRQQRVLRWLYHSQIPLRPRTSRSLPRRRQQLHPWQQALKDARPRGRRQAAPDCRESLRSRCS